MMKGNPAVIKVGSLPMLKLNFWQISIEPPETEVVTGVQWG